MAKEGTKYISAHKTDSDAFPALSENDLASSSYVRVAMSIKGKDHKWNIGDALIHEITTGETAQANAIPVFDLDTSSIKGNTYCIDNLILSKATEVEIVATTTVEDITVKVGEDELETLEGVTGLVDVVVTLSRTVSEAPLKTVLAVYGVANNGAETMTNVYENETATSLTVGENVITFEDVDLNGGNTINVFFWDDFANLFPYTAPVVFPEPVVAE